MPRLTTQPTTRSMPRWLPLAVLLAASLLGGCGNKGPLVLPSTPAAAGATVAPASSAPAPAASSSLRN